MGKEASHRGGNPDGTLKRARRGSILEVPRSSLNESRSGEVIKENKEKNGLGGGVLYRGR